MGRKIAAFYDEAYAYGGLEAKMKLAMLTRVPSPRALAEADTPSLLARFEDAMAQVRAQVPALVASQPPPREARPAPAAVAPGAGPSTSRLRELPGGEELLWGVLSSLHDAMAAVFERDGRCMLAWESKTLARRYGVRDEGVVAEAITALISRERGGDIRALFAGGEARPHETRVRFGEQNFWLSLALSPVHNAAGQVTAVAAFVQDVTDRKRSEAELQQREARLREHNRVYLDLMANKAQFVGDLDTTVRRITEAAARTLDAARASVWFYNADKTAIVCADLFERDAARHSAGVALEAAHFPLYFAGLREERTIAADDAHAHPRTAEFSAPYLAPLGINSMLDVPIWVGGEMVGVVCHEHIGPPRHWTPDEENFGYLMANFVALACELGRKAG